MPWRVEESDKVIVAGLWSIPGVGPKWLKKARALGNIGERPIGEWADELGSNIKWPRDRRLVDLGAELLARAKGHRMSVAWQGEPAYPDRLATISDAPPVLF